MLEYHMDGIRCHSNRLECHNDGVNEAMPTCCETTGMTLKAILTY